jgi:hypothetical protein
MADEEDHARGKGLITALDLVVVRCSCCSGSRCCSLLLLLLLLVLMPLLLLLVLLFLLLFFLLLLLLFLLLLLLFLLVVVALAVFALAAIFFIALTRRAWVVGILTPGGGEGRSYHPTRACGVIFRRRLSWGVEFVARLIAQLICMRD